MLLFFKFLQKEVKRIQIALFLFFFIVGDTVAQTVTVISRAGETGDLCSTIHC